MNVEENLEKDPYYKCTSKNRKSSGNSQKQKEMKKPM
jgi:hypothetical protein